MGHGKADESTVDLEEEAGEWIPPPNATRNQTIIKVVLAVLLALSLVGCTFYVLHLRSLHASEDSHAEDSHAEDDAHAEEPLPTTVPTVPLDSMMRQYTYKGHMSSLMQIATENNGSRAAHFGEKQTADYVQNTLAPYSGSFYAIQRLPFNIPYKRRLQTPEMVIDGEALAFVPTDSAENVFGDVTRVNDMHFNITDEPLWLGNGCDESQWNATSVTGRIVVTDQTGYADIKKSPVCGAATLRAFAQQYGAAALIVAFIDENGMDISTDTDYAGKMGYVHTTVNRGITGYNPVPDYEQGMEPFPVLYVRNPGAAKLKSASSVYLALSHVADYMPSQSVVVETLGGNATQVVGIIAHLDGVGAGAGANDDGSGTVAALSIAQALAERGVQPTNKVRFTFVGGEEIAVGGSYHYCKDHHKGDMVAALNMDMVGSLNGRITVCNGSAYNPDAFVSFGPTAPVWLTEDNIAAVKASSVALDNFFVEYLTANNLPYTIRANTKSSDQNNFQSYGIPASCLESGGGSYETLGEEWATDLNALGLWKADGAALVDPCYHSSCDNATNINYELMHILTKGVASVLDRIAGDADLKTHIGFQQIAPTHNAHGLEARISETSLRGFMSELMDVATANGGNRATPTGEKATADWIDATLKPYVDAGFYTVTPITFDLNVKNRSSDPVMIIDGEQLAFVPKDSPDNVFCDVTRVNTMALDLTGAPVYVGNGCEEAQWTAVDLAGKIAVTDMAGYAETKKSPVCSASTQREFAQKAGAAALVMAFVDEAGTDIVGGTDYAGKMGYMHTCVNRGLTGYTPIPDADQGMEPFPVFYVREPFASKFKAASSVTLRLNHVPGKMQGQTRIYDTTGGNATQVVGINAHLDGVLAGPGANDDGSGTVAALEIAVALANRGTQPANKIRFAFVGGEEIAVWGSYDYLLNHHAGDLVASLNMDMVGSKNGAIAVCNGSTFDPEAFVNFGPKPPAYANDALNAATTASSVTLDNIFVDYLQKHNIPHSVKQKSKGSDQNNYQMFGIPASCLESGGGSYESLDPAVAAPIKRGALWDVQPSAMVDPCYHSACDGYANVNFGVMTAITRAIAGVLDTLAGDADLPVTIGFIKPNYGA